MSKSIVSLPTLPHAVRSAQRRLRLDTSLKTVFLFCSFLTLPTALPSVVTGVILSVARVSGRPGNVLPGAGTLYKAQTLKFLDRASLYGTTPRITS